MNALIRCVLRLNPSELDSDEWHEAWAQVKFYLSVASNVKFE
jgi:hypothetical protein